MRELIYVIILLILTMTSVSLLKTYKQVPLKELRRRARKNDKFADSAYKVMSFGLSSEILLWTLISIFSAGLFIKLTQDLVWWLALIILFLVIWLTFWWVPNREVSRLNTRLAILCAPPLAKVISFLSPGLIRLEHLLGKIINLNIHTGIYEKEDLLELLDKQTNQPGSRISGTELKIASLALTFGDKTVGSVMTPKRKMRTLMVNDSVSPHLLNKIHKSGFSRLPVYEKSEEGKECVVGILYVKDLIDAVHVGSIGGVMDKKVFYVQEQAELEQVLDAFIKTKHHLFVVVNNFEEVVGVISIEDVLEQIIGKDIVDEFDEYDNLRAVADLEAKAERKKQKHVVELEPEPEQEPPKSEETVVE